MSMDGPFTIAAVHHGCLATVPTILTHDPLLSTIPPMKSMTDDRHSTSLGGMLRSGAGRQQVLRKNRGGNHLKALKGLHDFGDAKFLWQA